MLRTFPEPDPDATNGPPRSLPAELLELNYQNRLRAIGRHLDIEGFQNLVVFEVDGGFIVRAMDRDDRGVELMEFSDETYPERMIEATEARGSGERRDFTSPVAPTGYEDLLRALGRMIDLNGYGRVALAEAGSSLVLTGEDLKDRKPTPFDIALDRDGINEMLDEAFRQRRGQAGNKGSD